MDLNRIGGRDRRLDSLLAQARRWLKLDARIRKILPRNLQGYCRVACIDEEGRLVILASNNMALGRLKMLAPGLLTQFRATDGEIGGVLVKAAPQPPAKPKENTLRLSKDALQALDESAGRLAHHPELAAALRRLVDKHKND